MAPWLLNAAGSESVEGRETCGRVERRGQETRAERERRPAPSASARETRAERG
jgi:hypothetical protein